MMMYPFGRASGAHKYGGRTEGGEVLVSQDAFAQVIDILDELT